MNRVLLSILVMTILSGCLSSDSVKPSKKLTKVEDFKPNKKAFELEDMYIMFALRAEQIKDYVRASEFYSILYEKSNKKEYLYQYIKSLLIQRKSLSVIKIIDENNSKKFDYKLEKMKIIALVQLSEFEKAEVIALNLVSQTKKIEDSLLVADIYIKEKKFQTAYDYLRDKYLEDYNEEILDKLSFVLYQHLKKVKEAISMLENHSKTHGYSLKISARLIDIYTKEQNLDGLLNTYLKVYEINKSDKVATKILQIYEYKKDYLNSVDFLEKTSFDNLKLLQIYLGLKNYKKAYMLENKLYEENGDIKHLANSAIYQYESLEDKNNKKSLDEIVEKFKKVMLEEENSSYLNYFGYLLIEQNLDVKKGMEYVKKALVIDPDSYYYLDSLAWGYYKLGKCKKASKYMDRVVELEGGVNQEVVEHLDAINRCKKIK